MHGDLVPAALSLELHLKTGTPFILSKLGDAWSLVLALLLWKPGS